MNLPMFVVTGDGSNGQEIPFYQIGSEQGLLPAVVRIETGYATTLPGDGSDVGSGVAPVPGTFAEQALLMGPAERPDVIVDFTGLPDGTVVRIINTGPDAPFGGLPDVPADPGTFAAEGALLAPLRVDASGGVATDRDAELERVRVGLEREVRGRLSREGARQVEIRSEVDARYEGQAFEVTVPLGRRWRTTFHRAHERRYGFATPTRRVEPVRLRVRGAGYEGRHAGSRRTKRGTAAPGTLWDDGGRVARTALGPRDRVRGPARIEERTGTTLVPGGWEAVVIDHDGALRLERYP